MADGSLQLIADASSWLVAIGGHGLDRFVERVRPDLDKTAARNALKELSPKAYRLKKKREPVATWYILYDYDPPFTLVTRRVYFADAKPPQAVRVGWWVITVVRGHDCH